MKHTVQLVGGPHDGTLYCVEYWLPSLFLLRPITLAEYERLKIDEFTCWKAPEDLYERVGRTTIFKASKNQKVLEDKVWIEARSGGSKALV